MHTICMLSLKGGAGKSTVVQSLAVCATQHGQNTLIVELDPQGSLKNWSKRRDNPQPRVHQTLPQSLSDVLEEAREADTHWVFLDTPGHDTSIASAALEHADLIIIPCKIQSMKDFDSVLLTLNEANRSGKPAYVLMNQVPPNSPKLVRAKQVQIQQDYDIAVLSKYLSRRVDFEYCDEKGLSASEYNPAGDRRRGNQKPLQPHPVDLHKRSEVAKPIAEEGVIDPAEGLSLVPLLTDEERDEERQEEREEAEAVAALSFDDDPMLEQPIALPRDANASRTTGGVAPDSTFCHRNNHVGT